MNPRRLFALIVAVTLMAAVVDLPTRAPISFHWGPINLETVVARPEFDVTFLGKRFRSDLEIKQGLDLQGGTHVVLAADMGKLDPADRADALESAKNIIARRVDLFGVNEPVIQTSVVGDDYRIIVELPGVTEVSKTLDVIGQTAQLEFRELPLEATESATAADFMPTLLTGKHLKRARVEFGNTGAAEVSLEFDAEGTQLFSDITKRNIGKPVGIFIDNMLITYPRVNEQITGGSAVITGQFSVEEAKNLSIQLNAGALPVPIQILEQQNVGASLGQASVNKSLRAGLVGLAMVMLFMVLYYGSLGFLADLALLVYAILTLALYKLIPVTLTLPGLAGFILSVGMAVDGNILIFERMKEEVRAGKPWRTAMELGFGRAWDSIKDANVATLLTAFVLFNPFDWPFLVTSGMVRGFALTLSLGIAISLFTGIVVTRTFIRVLSRPGKKSEV